MIIDPKDIQVGHIITVNGYLCYINGEDKNYFYCECCDKHGFIPDITKFMEKKDTAGKAIMYLKTEEDWVMAKLEGKYVS